MSRAISCFRHPQFSATPSKSDMLKCIDTAGILMGAAKKDVQTLLHNLPDNATLDDIQYHLYVLEKIKRGQDDIANGRTYTNAQAKNHLNRWLTP